MMQKDDLDKLRTDIGSGQLKTWKEIHKGIMIFGLNIELDKQKHAFATLCDLYGIRKS